MIAAPLLSLALLAPSSGATPPALDASSPKAAAADGQEPVASTSVGMRVRIEELPIAGPKLQARPVADPGLATAIVRVLNVFPHGTGWRYNLEVTPFEEGTLDLAALLEPAEAGAPWDPPVLEVVVEALLAPEEVEPSDLDVPVPESVGGYRTGMTLFAAAWLAGLVAGVLDLEPAPPGLAIAERQRFGYDLYSARYGNVYSVRQLLQLVREAAGLWTPANLCWPRGERWIDALRPGVEPEGLETADEVLALRAQHLERVRQLLDQLDLFVFTLGLTETWQHRASGTVSPLAPGTPLW